jgi:hypothetical protein
VARRGLTRDQAALALALVAHVAIFALARSFGVDRVATPTPTDIGDALVPSIEIELSEAAPELPPSTASHAVVGRARSAPEAHAPGRDEPGSVAPVAIVLDEASLEPQASPSSLNSPSPVASSQSIDLGLAPDGWQRWALAAPSDRPSVRREPRAPLVRAPVASKTGGLQEGLEARDRELGLGPAGRVASALYQAAHGDTAPETGAVRFNVTVFRTGAVEVSLDDPKDERWRKVAERAAEDLRRSPPRIPPPREGYRLTLKITAEEAYPNGLKPRELEAPRLEARAPRFQSTEASKKELQRLNPTAGVGPELRDIRENRAISELPGIYRTSRGKVCSTRTGVAPLGPKEGKQVSALTLGAQGECDPVNVGANVQRIVRTEVVAETPF